MSKHLGYFATGSQSLEEPDGGGDITHVICFMSLSLLLGWYCSFTFRSHQFGCVLILDNLKLPVQIAFL